MITNSRPRDAGTAFYHHLAATNENGPSALNALYRGKQVATKTGRHLIVAAVSVRCGEFLGTRCGHYVPVPEPADPSLDAAECSPCAYLQAGDPRNPDGV